MSDTEDKTSEPAAEGGAATNPSAEKVAATPGSGSRTAWVGTAVGIGSAAIVAALLYANKKRS